MRHPFHTPPRQVGPALLLVLAAAAQGRVAEGRAEKPRPEEPRAPIERVTAELVLIEAYVTDLEDRPVRDLRVEDFVLQVDGRVEPIASLEYRESAAQEPSGPPGIGAGHPGPAARRFAIYFEDDTSAIPGQNQARAAVARFLASGLGPTDEVALVAHGRTLRLLSDFTTDHVTALRFLESAPGDSTPSSSYASDLQDNEERLREVLREPAPSDVRLRQFIFHLTTCASRDGARHRASVEALRSLVDALGRWTGHKAIVFMGQGMVESPLDYYMDRLGRAGLMEFDPEALQSAVRPVRLYDLKIEFKQLIDAANAAGVTIHAIDTHGQFAGDALGHRVARIGNETRAARQQSTALQTLALNTGGVASFSNDLVAALARSEGASRSYYILGYAPAGPPDGQHHSVNLRVRRPNVNLRWRRGFVRLKPPEARARAIQAAYSFPEFYPAIGHELAIVTGPSDKTGRLADLVIHVPPGRILFLPEAGRPTAHLEVGFVALDHARRETLRLARRLDVALETNARSDPALGLNLFHRLRLPLDGQSVVAVVHDLVSGAVGGARAHLGAEPRGRPQAPGLSLYSLRESSLWVEVGTGNGSEAPEGGAARYTLGPALKTVFTIGEPVACGFRLGGDAAPGTGPLRLLIREGERTVRDLPLDRSALDPGGTFKLPLPVDGLSPGPYRLVVVEEAAGVVIERGSLPFTLEAPAAQLARRLGSGL